MEKETKGNFPFGLDVLRLIWTGSVLHNDSTLSCCFNVAGDDTAVHIPFCPPASPTAAPSSNNASSSNASKADVRVNLPEQPPHHEQAQLQQQLLPPLVAQESIGTQIANQHKEETNLFTPMELGFAALSFHRDGGAAFRDVFGYLKPGMLCCLIGSPAVESGRQDLLECLAGGFCCAVCVCICNCVCEFAIV